MNPLLTTIPARQPEPFPRSAGCCAGSIPDKSASDAAIEAQRAALAYTVVELTGLNKMRLWQQGWSDGAASQPMRELDEPYHHIYENGYANGRLARRMANAESAIRFGVTNSIVRALGLMLLMVSCLFCQAGPQVVVMWDAVTNSWQPNEYILYHGLQQGLYSDVWGMSPTNGIVVTNDLAVGPNYFAVSALWANGSSAAFFSALSKGVVVTNTPSVVVSTITFGGTNLLGSYTPMTTNSSVFLPTAPQMFYKSLQTISPTNTYTTSTN